MMKRLRKLGLFLLMAMLVFNLAACNPPPDPDGEEPEVQTEWDVTVELPSTDQLEVASNPGVIEGAPELMIIGAVLDTYEWQGPSNVVSLYEYIKIYNNSETPTNMKGCRIVMGSPLINGAIYDDLETRAGDKVLCSSYIYMGYIDDDFIIPAKSIGLVWTHPYYWTVVGGTGGYAAAYSTTVIHKDFGQKKGPINQTVEDFKEFWNMSDSDVPVFKLPNMGIVGKMGGNGPYPIYTPGAGQAYTHTNSTLIRSFEIQRFNDQEGAATIELLNKYDELSDEEKVEPPFIYERQCFNVMEIKDNGELVDGYLHTNAWKYWDAVNRATFCGRINTDTLEAGQKTVDFTGTGNAGVRGWTHNTELQFRPPVAGSKIMRWQLPLRELALIESYLEERHANVLHFAKEDILTYKFVEKTVKVNIDPAEFTIDWRSNEIRNNSRMECASPSKIHAINVTNPPA